MQSMSNQLTLRLRAAIRLGPPRRGWSAMPSNPCNWVMHGLGLVLGVAQANPAPNLPFGGMMPNSTYSYEASSLDSPYLRSTDFYGFDKPDTDDKDRWTDLLGEFKWPFLTNIGIGAFYNDNVLMNGFNKKGSFGTTLTPSLTLPLGSPRYFTVLNYALRANIYENVSYNNTVGNYLNATSTFG